MNIALVGSGPSLAGAGRGAAIDAHDGIMRLFDCGWQNEADHGIVWTWGLIPAPWRRIDFARKAAAENLLPLGGWFAYHFGARLPRLPAGTRLIDAQGWNARLNQVAGRTGLRITRGFAMFVAAALMGPKRITAYGFDGLAAGRIAGYAYHPGYWTGSFDEAAASARHDLAAERALLDELAAASGVEIVFA
jgi:hypothetical protein